MALVYKLANKIFNIFFNSEIRKFRLIFDRFSANGDFPFQAKAQSSQVW